MFYGLFRGFYKKAYKKVNKLITEGKSYLINKKKIFVLFQTRVDDKKKHSEDKLLNNNDSTDNYNNYSKNDTTQLYYKPTEKMEESYVTIRQRAFVSKN